MPHRPPILINLIIIPTLVRLVPEKVDRRVLDTANAFFFFKVLQAVGFVPAGGEDVEGDLAADGVAVGAEVSVVCVDRGGVGGSGDG